MLITRLEVQDFRKFKAIDHELGPGVNVIKGALNETGKSTFLDALVVGLFDNPRSTKKELDGNITWGSDKKPKITIEMEHEGTQFRLCKDFGPGTMTLRQRNSGEEWRTAGEVAAALRGMLGTASKELFLATCCVRQDEVARIARHSKQISDSLEEVVTGGADEMLASKVIDRLEKHVRQLTKGIERPTRSPGPIADLRQQIDSLQKELGTIRESVARLEQARLELTETVDQLECDRAALKDKNALLEKNRLRTQIEQNIARLSQEYDKVEVTLWDCRQLQGEVERAECALRELGFENPKSLEAIDQELQSSETRRKGLESDLAKRRDDLQNTVAELRGKARLSRAGSRGVLAAGVTLFVAGLVGTILDVASVPITVGGTAFGALVVGTSLWSRAAMAQVTTHRSEVESRIRSMENTLEDILQEQTGLLSQAGCQSIAQFQALRGRVRELSEQKLTAESKLAGKLGKRTIEEMEGERQAAARALAQEQAKLTEDLQATRLEPDRYLQLENEVKELSERVTSLEKKANDCRVAIRSLRYDADDQVRAEEQLEQLEEQLRREERRVSICEVARQCMVEARQQTLVSPKDRLEEEIQRHFEAFTDGKYRQVGLGEDALDFRVWSTEANDWVRPDELSAGTIDQFYFACRLGLLQVIYGDVRPPLILDDPFVNFDRPRLQRTLQWLKQVSSEYQVLLFSLWDAYDDIGDTVIELPSG